MWELDYKESWALKNWCFWTVVLEKTLESPLDCEEIQPVHSKGDQSWIFIGRSNAETETPILWPPDVKTWFIWKDPDAGKDWGREEKGTTEDEMVGWHHQLDGHVWVDSWSWWWTGRPGVLRFMGSPRVGHDWATELNWTLTYGWIFFYMCFVILNCKLIFKGTLRKSLVLDFRVFSSVHFCIFPPRTQRVFITSVKNDYVNFLCISVLIR